MDDRRPLTWRDHLADDRLYRRPALLLSAIVVVLLMVGCAGTPFIQEPQSGILCTDVQFVPESEIPLHCPPGTLACATVGDGKSLQRIYTTKPRGWDDHERILHLGHEVLHNLGATHGSPVTGAMR
jgi:hypothetical protein